MADETLPREKAPKAPNGVPWGDPKWGVRVDPAEMAELRRKRENVIGDDGVRRIRMSKTGSEWDEPRLERYEEMGYKVDDKGRHYILSIPQAEYKKQEAARVERTVAVSPKPKRDKEFSVNTEDTLAPVSTQELLAEKA